MRQVSQDFEKLWGGFSLTTAEILYRLPDHKSILQTYFWQDYDMAPKFPKLTDFLNFWERELDGPLYQVRVMHTNLIRPLEIKALNQRVVLVH